MTENNDKEEYKIGIDIIKHYSNMENTQLYVYVVLMGAAVAFIFMENTQTDTFLKKCKVGAFLISLCFYIMQESHIYIINHYLKRVSQIENKLGYEGFSKMFGYPKYRFTPGKWALRILYILFTFFWLYIIIINPDYS